MIFDFFSNEWWLAIAVAFLMYLIGRVSTKCKEIQQKVELTRDHILKFWNDVDTNLRRIESNIDRVCPSVNDMTYTQDEIKEKLTKIQEQINELRLRIDK
ncbi:hypothetical protein [Vibrio parahaemolyticus]|uniref:hypothetical protein n=1 Tax=Gammaproteobacteria TaxID=1236 RepID=UPI001EECD7C6|nr:hypothetical protein [Vibrio parahaemolyticus]MCG6489827.1 hypothetical protein [Vibrio parahaemolyticus]